MPSKTPKQAKFMRTVAHNADFAKKAGVPQSVGREFEAADEAKADRGTHLRHMKPYVSGSSVNRDK